ncbi:MULTISPECIES: ATP-binding protein [unclassified Bradyrhizobium]|uniref:ATP-binding protein n=1 Tax=unclassified Bradyrhizobium TaxID=2631580 RepID=UPI001FFC1029|nr:MULTISPECIES: ATP-binding protein [unclassified Bradyrhizobium]MCK1319764.1 ATP-binding protein [Bradyrhizobium sp. 156]MCK1500571.1 ATP-binding protein [Bradyrhizobium sp. 188]MCK1566765.1 ATP-binding protein [Bradyrhizobium sp. 173]UPJ27948.1 ATP-binding protein [Bradyrhizobium sp. CW1]UPJ80946.1 ATP-binding protein [Bradyrhizobium sp. 184]
MAEEEGQTIWGGPTKRFFVSMLTRDIELKDAILDLVDNSIDGATRQLKSKAKKPDAYKGFETRLSISAKSFDISDNCGGIPKGAIKDAFLLGRPKVDKDKGLPTIGVYGMLMCAILSKGLQVAAPLEKLFGPITCVISLET